MWGSGGGATVSDLSICGSLLSCCPLLLLTCTLLMAFIPFEAPGSSGG